MEGERQIKRKLYRSSTGGSTSNVGAEVHANLEEMRAIMDRLNHLTVGKTISMSPEYTADVVRLNKSVQDDLISMFRKLRGPISKPRDFNNPNVLQLTGFCRMKKPMGADIIRFLGTHDITPGRMGFIIEEYGADYFLITFNTVEEADKIMGLENPNMIVYSMTNEITTVSFKPVFRKYMDI
jgi:hypothetical protein